MAEVKIININTGQAVKNIAELRDNIKYYKQELEKADLTQNEHQEILVRLQENQAALRNAMHATTASMADITAAATAANVTFDDQNQLVQKETISYNELVRELAILKQQWRATTDEQERAKLGEKINNVNDRLKEMDKTVGVFGRNVGNYIGAVDHLALSMSKMGPGAAAVVGPVMAANNAFKVMAANPAIAAIGILATVLGKIIEAMKSSEEGAQGMSEALAPLKTIGDAVTRVLQGLGQAVVWLVKGFTDLTQAIFGTNKATEERIALAQEERRLAEQARATTIANAEAERDIAELRAKAADKLTYTAQERLAFLEEAGRREAEIAQRALQDAQLQYEIIHARNQLSRSSAEELQEEADAYAAMVQAETAYYQSIRTIRTGINRAKSEEARDARQAAKAAEEARKAELESYRALLQQEINLLQAGSEERLAKQRELLEREYLAAVANARQKIHNAETLNRTLLALQRKYQADLEQAEREHRAALLHIQLQGLANTAAQYANGTRENLRALKDLRKAELDTMYQEEGETEADYTARRLAAQWAYYEAVRAFNEKVVGETTAALELAYAQSERTQEQTLAYELQMAEARLRQIEILGKEAGETEEQYLIRRANAEREIVEAQNALLDYAEQQELQRRQNRLAALEEGSLQYLAEAIDLKQYELDTLHRLEGESEDEFRARQLEAEKNYIAAKRALWTASLNIYKQVASATSGILGSIADMYEADTDATEKQVRNAKNLRIAGATIDMLSGVVSAISTAQQLGPIAGPIMAAINSAAVIAAGVANISKIRSQQVSKSGGSGSTSATAAVVNAPSTSTEFTQVRTITGASEEDRLNRMAEDQRVYILSSDLEADRNDKRVQVDETTF